MIDIEEHKHKIFFRILVVFICVLILRTFVVQGFVVRGNSMAPTIQSGDFILINKIAYIRHKPQRGDIVVAWTRDDSKRVIKRVVGLPGEVFMQSDGILNNVDPQEYYLAGDNSEESATSEDFGFVDAWDIKGKVFGAVRLRSLKYIDF
jgi:signal peptidase I